MIIILNLLSSIFENIFCIVEKKYGVDDLNTLSGPYEENHNPVKSQFTSHLQIWLFMILKNISLMCRSPVILERLPKLHVLFLVRLIDIDIW